MSCKAKMDIDFFEMFWFVGVTVAINCLVFVVCGLLELTERHGLFQDAKIQKKPLSCTQPSLDHVLLHLVKLHFLVQPVGLPVFYIIMKWRGVEFSGPAPSWQEVLSQLPLFFLIEDATFYWTHRALHTKWLYKTVHKMHHEFKQPNCWAVEYTHIIEYSLTNSAGIFLGSLLLKSHVITFWIWLVIRILEGIDGHCGYDFWFSPFRYFPFRPGANIHDYHHSHNVGNYGSFFTFWDHICGTDLSYRNYKKREREKPSIH